MKKINIATFVACMCLSWPVMVNATTNGTQCLNEIQVNAPDEKDSTGNSLSNKEKPCISSKDTSVDKKDTPSHPTDKESKSSTNEKNGKSSHSCKLPTNGRDNIKRPYF